MPAALPVDWTAIKEAMIAGVPATDLAIRYGMLKRDDSGEPIIRDGKPVGNTIAIRTRCCREQWPVPQAIKERAAKAIAHTRRTATLHAQAYTQTHGPQAQHTHDAPPFPPATEGGQPQTDSTQRTSTDTGPDRQVATLQHPPQSLEIIAERLAGLANGHPLAMAEYVVKKRDEMIAKDLLPAPTNWREAGQLDNIARRNMGIDRAESAGVQVNVGVWGGDAKVKAWDGGEYDV